MDGSMRKEAAHMKITTCYTARLGAQMVSRTSGKQKSADAFTGIFHTESADFAAGRYDKYIQDKN